MAVAKKETTELTVPPLRRGSTKIRIVGTTPLFQNRMENKAKQQLLVGGAKRGTADKSKIKHNPHQEYLDSAEILLTGPTALGLKVTAIKGSMSEAAIETPGVTKASVQRLLFMPGDFVSLYGVPQLRMDVTRSADVAKTPDIRTRAYLPLWGAEVDIQFITPQLSLLAVVSLLCNAGLLIGVGDFRQGKGKGSFGLFRVLGEGEPDKEWDELVTNHGRLAQELALAHPEYANKDTADLMEFFHGEVKRRAA
jgi:hypothetical protein